MVSSSHFPPSLSRPVKKNSFKNLFLSSLISRLLLHSLFTLSFFVILPFFFVPSPWKLVVKKIRPRKWNDCRGEIGKGGGVGEVGSGGRGSGKRWDRRWDRESEGEGEIVKGIGKEAVEGGVEGS